MLEHYNDYYKIRVPRQNKSIGYVFGMIENKKDIYGISEYSVSQTTLEQIFQTFALQEVDSKKGIIFEKLPNGQVGRRHAHSQPVVMGTPVRSIENPDKEANRRSVARMNSIAMKNPMARLSSMRIQ